MLQHSLQEIIPRPSNDSKQISHEILDLQKDSRERLITSKRQHELNMIRIRHREALQQFEMDRFQLTEYLQLNPIDQIPLESGTDIITHLKMCVDIQKKKNNAIRKETSTLEVDISHQRERLKKVCDQVEHVERETGITFKSDVLNTFRPHAEVRADIHNLSVRIERAQVELRQGEILLNKKAHLLAELHEEVNKREEFHEALYQLRNTYRVVSKETSLAQESVQDMKNVHLEKDMYLQSVLNSRDLIPSHVLQQEIEFLNQQKQQKENQLSEQVRMIATQRYRIGILHDRLEGLVSCLKDIDIWPAIESSLHTSMMSMDDTDVIPYTQTSEQVIPSDERVRKDLLEVAQAALIQIEKDVSIRDILVVERDHAVESLGYKVDAIVMRTEEDSQVREYDKYEFQIKMEQERRELEARELYIREGLDALNTENARLKKEILM